MRKKVIWAAIIALAAAAATFLWPFRLSIGGSPLVAVTYVELGVEDGHAAQQTAKYEFRAGSKEYIAIEQALEKHRYHRSLGTFFGDGTIKGGDIGYTLYLHTGQANLSLVGTGEISINGRVFRLGYWGSAAALSVMDEILQIIKAS